METQMTLHSSQGVQESWYEFPYHYVTSLSPNFSISRTYDWSLNYASAVQFLINQISINSECASLVDIGCGDGRLTHELKKAHPTMKLAGIDYSERSISLAKALNHGNNISFSALDLIDNPISAEFDAAILMEVYEHIEPSKASEFLKGVSAQLCKGGVLHLTVPHENIPCAKHHFRHFSSELLTAELSEYFDVIEVKPFERKSKKRRWLQRILCNRLFVLNNAKLLNMVYEYYMRNLFHVEDESKCQRLYVMAKRK